MILCNQHNNGRHERFIIVHDNRPYVFCVPCFVQESSELQKQTVCEKVRQLFFILEGKQKVGFSVDSWCACFISKATSLVNVNADEVPLKRTHQLSTSQVMMQQVSREQEAKMNHIQALVRCYRNSVETNRKLLEQAALSTEEDDPLAFIQVSRCF